MAESESPAASESFEAALQRLADLVAGMESGSLGLSDSIAAYERGVGILKRLHEQLAVAEERATPDALHAWADTWEAWANDVDPAGGS